MLQRVSLICLQYQKRWQETEQGFLVCVCVCVCMCVCVCYGHGGRQCSCPQRYLHPTPGTCGNVTLRGKGCFADEFRIILDYPGESSVIVSFLISERGRRGGWRRRCNDGSRYWSDVIKDLSRELWSSPELETESSLHHGGALLTP